MLNSEFNVHVQPSINSTLSELLFQFPRMNENRTFLLDFFEMFKSSIGDSPQILNFTESDTSHQKKCLFQKQEHGQTLKVELIHFTGLHWTGPHIHPQFLMEWIISGTLEEQCYSHINGEYRANAIQVRYSNDFRMIDDPSGHPHNVRSKEGCCQVLCLSLGSTPVTPIEIGS